MMPKSVLLFVLLIIMIAAVSPLASGQQFYSYVDETGVQVFTNIPPVSDEIPEVFFAEAQNKPQDLIFPPEMIEPDSRTYDSIINKYASYYELDPLLIHSIIATESGFNPKAVSSKGARGLMQLMPDTARRLGVKNIFDPEQNIQAGVRHLRSLMDTFNNNLDLSLAAYNAGENLVRRLGRVPSYKETTEYVRTVTRRYREKRKGDQDDPVEHPTYRYVDAKGVLHLTNVPPVH